MDDKKLKGILISGNYLEAGEVEKAAEAATGRKSTLAEYLLSEGLITRDILGQAIAESYQVPYASLSAHPPLRSQILQIPEEIAAQHRAVFFGEDLHTVMVATENPVDKELVKKLEPVFAPKVVKLAYAPAEEIEPFFVSYRPPLQTRFAEILAKQEKVAPEIIDEIIRDAVSFRASDIHLEPQEAEVMVRFRIDGVLRDAGQLSPDQYLNIVNHLKVKANLRIDEHLSAQDGSIRHELDGERTDLRISVVPTMAGERISIRILSRYVRSLNFGDLGMSPEDQKRIEESARKPFGMILASGPTGSGKTTTLYALVRLLNQPEVNIMTIEDPVEYRVAGINQIQVNPQTNLTFAQGLKSIVRQDPNIVLVGEIRDRETAELATNAALTGHLLLSTFHANNASAAIPRLLEMGVEPFLLSSTLELVLAQRLVRRICSSCRYTLAGSAQEVEKNLPPGIGKDVKRPTAMYKGKGCKVCGETGYHGRVAIFELISVTPDLKELILKRPSAGEIWERAVKDGSRSLFEDGLGKVEQGITTLDEVLRVAPPQ